VANNRKPWPSRNFVLMDYRRRGKYNASQSSRGVFVVQGDCTSRSDSGRKQPSRTRTVTRKKRPMIKTVRHNLIKGAKASITGCPLTETGSGLTLSRTAWRYGRSESLRRRQVTVLERRRLSRLCQLGPATPLSENPYSSSS
jgi:hypothetical protein